MKWLSHLHFLSVFFFCRILKIENTLEAIVSDIEMLDRLSFKEKKFAAKLNALNNSHFEGALMSFLQQKSWLVVKKLFLLCCFMLYEVSYVILHVICYMRRCVRGVYFRRVLSVKFKLYLVFYISYVILYVKCCMLHFEFHMLYVYWAPCSSTGSLSEERSLSKSTLRMLYLIFYLYCIHVTSLRIWYTYLNVSKY